MNRGIIKPNTTIPSCEVVDTREVRETRNFLPRSVYRLHKHTLNTYYVDRPITKKTRTEDYPSKKYFNHGFSTMLPAIFQVFDEKASRRAGDRIKGTPCKTEAFIGLHIISQNVIAMYNGYYNIAEILPSINRLSSNLPPPEHNIVVDSV